MAGSKPAWAHDARTGPVRDYIDQKVFACEGMVVVIDHNQEQHWVSVSYWIAAQRHPASPSCEKIIADRREHNSRSGCGICEQRLRGCQNIMECVKEAKAMGDPTDPQVQAFWKRHNSLRVAGYAKAGSRQSRVDILSKIADSSVPTTLLQKDGTKATIQPKKLILPNSAKPVAEYKPPIPVRKAATNE